MKIKDTIEALKVARKIGVTLNLIAEHGVGKSSVIKQYAKEMGMQYKEFRTGQAADAGDLTGLPEFAEITDIDENGKEFTYKVTNYVLPEWFPRKPNSLIFFDEANRGAKDILNGIFEVILDMSMKGIPLPKGCQVVSAMNPPTEDYSGTLDFDDKAWLDRFVHVKFAPDFAEFREYQNSKYQGSGFLEYLGEDNRMLQGTTEFFEVGSLVTPSRRSWETAFKMEQLFDNGEMSEGVFFELLMGTVGMEAANAALNYKKTQVKALKATEIIESYKKGDIRDRVAKAIEKDRTDLIGTALQDIDAEFAKRKSLSNVEANNLIDFAKDLSKAAEQQYTFLTLVIKHMNGCTGECEGFEVLEGGKGLGHSVEMVKVIEKTRVAREKAGQEMEKAKAKKAKAKETEEVPF